MATELPLVCCLTATHGRFNWLRHALACFLDQDYENRLLIILNNHPEPLRLAPGIDKVLIYNESGKTTLGACRNRLLELLPSDAAFIRTWDDDDIYLPWTLRQGVENIGDAPAFKPQRSWAWALKANKLELCDNVFEAAMLVRADVAKRYGYADSSGDEHEPLLRGIQKEGGCRRREFGLLASYCYTWDNGNYHASGTLGNGQVEDKRAEEWKRANQDTGTGWPLTPDWFAMGYLRKAFFQTVRDKCGKEHPYETLRVREV